MPRIYLDCLILIGIFRGNENYRAFPSAGTIQTKKHFRLLIR